MNDTFDDIRKKQLEIILSKTPSERFMMGADMCDSVYLIVRNRIANENPDYSEGEIVAAIFRRYYSDCFSEEDLLKISKSIHDFHKKKSDRQTHII